MCVYGHILVELTDILKWEEEVELNQINCQCMNEKRDSRFFEKENVQWIHDTQMLSLPNGYRRLERRPIKRAERGGTRGFRVSAEPFH